MDTETKRAYLTTKNRLLNSNNISKVVYEVAMEYGLDLESVRALIERLKAKRN